MTNHTKTPKAFLPYVIDYNLISDDKCKPPGYYEPKPFIILPMHYFEDGVIAFVKPDEKTGPVMRPVERVPYENGVHAWEFVLIHEFDHKFIHEIGGIQNEAGINRHVAYTVGPKYGIDRFPFSSY